jgi:hypothetical protein
MANGRSLLNRAAPAVAGVTLTVLRENDGGTYTGTITDARAGNTRSIAETTAGPRFERRERDYLITVTSYVLDTLGVVEPEAGDLFTETINGVARKWVVTPFSGLPPVEEDQGTNRYRVHVRRLVDAQGN